MTGIEYFSTKSEGIGGRLKQRISDFKVREITKEGKQCEILVFGEDNEKKELEKVWLEPPAEEEKKETLHLTLEKFNYDTNLALRLLCRFLRVSRKRIGFAGMKDKRAITSQKISVWKPDYNAVKGFRSRYLDLRDAEWRAERIELGDLKGNAFEITVRDIGLSEKECEKRIRECFDEMKQGIANYFGEQRFGGIREITHLVGREFLKGKTKEAVMLYLTSVSPQEEEEVTIARNNLLNSGDFSAASNEFPVKYRYERAIIHHLCKYPNDFAGAFRKLPKNLCYMFSHAFQSYLFNKVINKRIEEGIGLKAVEGDVLLDGIPTAPLYGFESVLAEGKAGEIEKKVLEEEGFSLSEFKVAGMPELSSKGARKKILLLPENLEFRGISSDEFNEGKLKAMVSFSLDKGNYATTVLREIMKN
ncbi:MAG: tRNA pseudouridine(13) synthase TruD [Candidatus Diapherotrites archaeon]